MQRRRIIVDISEAYAYMGEIQAYQKVLEHLVEIPDLYTLDDGALLALAAQQVYIDSLIDEAYNKMIVAVWVDLGIDGIDLDKANNCRFIVKDGRIYLFASFCESYDMPSIESLKTPRKPYRPAIIDLFKGERSFFR